MKLFISTYKSFRKGMNIDVDVKNTEFISYHQTPNIYHSMSIWR